MLASNKTPRPEGEMWVAALWRYPVKSLAGESLQEAELAADGVVGDRHILVVHDQNGHVLTSRNHPRLLGLKGSLGADGVPQINGRPWNAPESAQAVMEAAGPQARLIHWAGPERFDILPLLVATDGAIAAFGYDGRRLRPNIVIGGVQGMAERDWEGKRMQIGSAVIAFDDLRDRCVMTTYDPDTQKQDHGVLRHIVKQFDGKLALNTAVVTGGRIAVGDPVRLLD